MFSLFSTELIFNFYLYFYYFLFLAHKYISLQTHVSNFFAIINIQNIEYTVTRQKFIHLNERDRNFFRCSPSDSWFQTGEKKNCWESCGVMRERKHLLVYVYNVVVCTRRRLSEWKMWIKKKSAWSGKEKAQL